MPVLYLLAIPTIALLLFAVALMINNIRHKKRIALRVKRLYESSLYTDMGPFMIACRSGRIEQLIIQKNGLTAQCWYSGTLRELFLKMDDLKRPLLSDGQQEAICRLLEKEIPLLSDRTKYQKRVFYRRLPNDDYEFSCTYTIKPKYKQKMNRIHFGEINT